jgi:hypothetical protein
MVEHMHICVMAWSIFFAWDGAVNSSCDISLRHITHGCFSRKKGLRRLQQILFYYHGLLAKDISQNSALLCSPLNLVGLNKSSHGHYYSCRLSFNNINVIGLFPEFFSP